MNARTVALLVVLAGSAYLIIYKRDELTAAVDELLGGNAFSPSTPQGALTSNAVTPIPQQPSTTARVVTAASATAAAILPAVLGGGTAAGAGAGAGGAAGAGAGISTAAAITAAGIAAGAAILIWGIIAKGWFRGGWEGTKGNQLRDTFFLEFNRAYGLPYTAGNDAQLTAGFARACGDCGMPGYEADRMLRVLHNAESESQWNDAMNDCKETFDRYASCSQSAVIPAWRAAQLRGEVVFSSGQTPDQYLAALRASRANPDLISDIARGGWS